MHEILSRKPVANEMKWVISGRPDSEQHQKILPDYCYKHIRPLRADDFQSIHANFRGDNDY